MSNSKPNYFQRRTKPQGPRANERIRALDVQVIGSDGGNFGVMPLKKAIELAKNEELDKDDELYVWQDPSADNSYTVYLTESSFGGYLIG